MELCHQAASRPNVIITLPLFVYGSLACAVAEENSAERIARLEREIETLKKENERLGGLLILEEALRAAKRRAAPFSRAPQSMSPKTGKQTREKVRTPMSSPFPRTIDEVVEVPLPTKCPHCGGDWRKGKCFPSYQTEIPVPQVLQIECRFSLWSLRFARPLRRLTGLAGQPASRSVIFGRMRDFSQSRSPQCRRFERQTSSSLVSADV
jgi:hypothetical protein